MGKGRGTGRGELQWLSKRKNVCSQSKCAAIAVEEMPEPELAGAAITAQVKSTAGFSCQREREAGEKEEERGGGERTTLLGRSSRRQTK